MLQRDQSERGLLRERDDVPGRPYLLLVAAGMRQRMLSLRGDLRERVMLSVVAGMRWHVLPIGPELREWDLLPLDAVMR